MPMAINSGTKRSEVMGMISFLRFWRHQMAASYWEATRVLNRGRPGAVLYTVGAICGWSALIRGGINSGINRSGMAVGASCAIYKKPKMADLSSGEMQPI